MQEKYKTLKHEPGKHRELVGGLWDELGILQFNFLKSHGMVPEHTLLDLGCGSLRFGVHVIPYLEQGHYYGIDMHEWLVTDGVEKELGQALFLEKKPQLYINETFDAAHFGVQFDFIIMQSLFTHLSVHTIETCIAALPEVMHQNTKYFFTFLENESPEHDKKINEEPYHQPSWFYEVLAKKYGLRYTYIGNWNHPRNQKIALLTREEK